MAEDSQPRILRIPRVEQENAVVLLRISSNGNAKIDLHIAGTEGSSPFTASLKQSRIRTLRDRKYKGDESEWETALCASLLREPVPQEFAEALEGLETVATVEADEELHIIIRKNIGGITQRLGTLTLRRDDNYNIELFDWTSAAAAISESLSTNLSSLQRALDSHAQTISDLRAQLADLVTAKNEHETALLEKCAALLNTKKLKIRDQQRLLAAAKVDPRTAAAVASARDDGTKGRKAGPSRPSKRKAKAAALPSDSESEGFDQVGARGGDDAADREEEDRGEGRPETPDKSDLDETDDDEADIVDDIGTSEPAARGVGRKGKALDDMGEGEAGGGEDRAGGDEGGKETPPRRDLPFIAAGGARRMEKEDVKVEDAGKEDNGGTGVVMDDEETDDEL